MHSNRRDYLHKGTVSNMCNIMLFGKVIWMGVFIAACNAIDIPLATPFRGVPTSQDKFLRALNYAVQSATQIKSRVAEVAGDRQDLLAPLLPVTVCHATENLQGYSKSLLIQCPLGLATSFRRHD